MALKEKKEGSAREAAVRLHQHRHFKDLGNRLNAYRRRLPTICKLLSYGPCKCNDGDGFYTINTEIEKLKQTIGFACFGKLENESTGDSEKRLHAIESIFKQILKIQTGDKILISIVYVSLNIEGEGSNVVDFPVFRVPDPEKKKYLFVDFEGRKYESWAGFVRYNNLPKAFWCYPKNGMYTECSEGNLELCFGYTPAAKFGRSVLCAIDKIASVLSFGCVFGTFFPPVATLCAVGSGALGLYGVVRDTCKLADRSKNGQSLKDREAFSHWISLGSSVLGIGSLGVTAGITAMAKDGKVVSDLCCKVVDGINYSSLLVEVVCIVDQGSAILKAEKGKKNQLYIKLMVRVLFFAHSVVTFKTAKTLVDENRWVKSHSGKETDIIFLNYISSETDYESQFSMNKDDSEMEEEPVLLARIQQYLKKVTVSDMHIFLEKMKESCKGMRYSTCVMQAIDIVLDILRCRDVQTAIKIVLELTKLASAFCMSKKSERLKDIEFIPTIITKILGSRPDQDVYHFPEDHREWDSDGKLKKDEYLAIAQNTFRLVNVPATYFQHIGGIACVYFKHVGYVKITSLIEEKIIVIQKFKVRVTESQNKNSKMM